MLLEELEYEVDWWEQDFAPAASAASIHSDVGLCVEGSLYSVRERSFQKLLGEGGRLAVWFALRV